MSFSQVTWRRMCHTFVSGHTHTRTKGSLVSGPSRSTLPCGAYSDRSAPLNCCGTVVLFRHNHTQHREGAALLHLNLHNWARMLHRARGLSVPLCIEGPRKKRSDRRTTSDPSDFQDAVCPWTYTYRQARLDVRLLVGPALFLMDCHVTGLRNMV